MTPTWIFFDAGNTLIRLNYGILLEALAAEGFPVDRETIEKAELAERPRLEGLIIRRWSQGDVPRTGWIEEQVWRDYWRRVLLACGAATERADGLVSTALSITRPAGSWDRLEPDTRLVLDSLRSRGHRLGVISNSSGTLEDHLNSIDLADRFEVIIDSKQVGIEKPHPGIFELALERAGSVAPASALYVGDVYSIDVLGASGAGLEACLYDPGGVWSPGILPEGAPACRVLRSLREIEMLVSLRT